MRPTLPTGTTTFLFAQILERLSRRIDLFKGGRDADPRQQTLRAMIDWSYELLAVEEQQLFARLSVLAGGCTLEAAEEDRTRAARVQRREDARTPTAIELALETGVD